MVGQPYFVRTVERKDGRVETGLLAAEDDSSISLKNENDAVKVILKKDIDQMSVQPKSLMPEGLDKNLTVQDFRDLVRYLEANPFLTDVSVAGPFSEKKKAVLDVDQPLATKGLSWSRPVVGPPGRIVLPASQGEGNVLTWVTGEVIAPSLMRTRLQLGAVHPLQVWLNGKVIYSGKPGTSQAIPDHAGVDVVLREGVNQLLFQVTYQGTKVVLYARLLDPSRRLRYRWC